MRRHVEFITLWVLSTIGAFTLIMTALVVAYIFYVMWREKQAPASEAVTYTQGAAYDACLDEPTTDHDAEIARRLLNW